MKRGSIVMLVGAALLSIGLYLLPIGQDFVWYHLYEAAGHNVAIAWTYMYIVSLGLIGLGIWLLYTIAGYRFGLKRIRGGRR